MKPIYFVNISFNIFIKICTKMLIFFTPKETMLLKLLVTFVKTYF